MIDAGVFDQAAPQKIYTLHRGQLPIGTLACPPSPIRGRLEISPNSKRTSRYRMDHWRGSFSPNPS
jgi:hypothetical protein